MPEEIEIINPSIATFVTLDSISGKLTKLINLTLRNQELLNSILRQQIEEADEGKYIRKSGTVTPTTFVEINTLIDPGHSVKGYEVTNDGPNPIYVAHNATISGLQPDTIDVTDNRFQEVAANEDIEFNYNRKKIRNIYLLAKGGNSNYRIWLVW